MWVYTDAAPVLEEWTALAYRVGTVFSSRPSFVLEVARALNVDCAYIAARRDGRLVAFGALALVRRGPLTIAKVVGTDLGVPLEFLSEDAEASDAVLDAIASHGFMFSAESLIQGDLTASRFRRHPAWCVDVAVRERVAVIEMRRGDTAVDLRSPKSLKRLRRYRRAEGSFEIEMVSTAEAVESRWDEMVRVARAGVASTDKVNYLVSPHGGFAKAFLTAEAGAGRLCIAGIVIDGVWVAHEIGLRTGTRIEGWLTHYDPAFAHVQPGHQLAEWFANHHDELGVAQLDRGIGVNAIKSAWTGSGYDVLRVSAVPSRWVVSRLLVTAFARFSPAVACVRRTGRLALVKVGVRPP